MDNIPLEDEPIEPFDDYEDYEDQMMQEAERQEILRAKKASIESLTAPSSSFGGGSSQQVGVGAGMRGSSSSSAWMGGTADELPAQRDFLAMLSQQQNDQERMAQAQAQQRQLQKQQQQQQQQQKGKGQWQRNGAGASRPIGSGGGGDTGDLGDLEIKKVKERVKLVKLDADKLLGPRGFPALLTQGKALRIRHKYKNSAEKNANVKSNMTDLMRVYQTWAHNLFPKATLRDFIKLAESRCKTDKQIRSSMNGWRDAYWDQKKQAKEAAEEEQRKTQAAEDGSLHDSVWENNHGAEYDTSSAVDGSGGNSRSAYLGEEGPEPELQTPMLTQEQARSRVSREKQKQQQQREKAKNAVSGYSVSAAMRMDMSDEEAEDEAEFEARMARMRASLNQDTSSPARRSTSTSQWRQQSEEDEEDMMMAIDEAAKTSTSKYKIDLDDSELEEEEEEEEDEPLFTHRALKMMDRDTASKITTAVAAEAAAAAVVAVSAEDDKEADIEPLSPTVVPLSSSQQQADGSQLREALLFDDQDEEGQGPSITQASSMAAKRKPSRRAILLEDSDDE